MTVKKGNKIKVHYTGTLDDGTQFDSSEGREPLEFAVGEGMVVKGFDDAVVGMEKDVEKEVKIKAEDAYGDRKEELVMEFSKDMIGEGKEAKEGMMIAVGLPNGKNFPGKIVEVKEKVLKIDMNPPLAGKDLNFKIKVVEIN
jgi:peptidylprolyl isomerase